MATVRGREWDLVIQPKSGRFDFNLGELLRYRDLILLLVRRDFVTFYKQTILGPLWYVIQPVANALIFNVIFGKIAQIPTDGAPPFLFYMAGTVVWAYFAQCLVGTSSTFVANASVFGKVYFPRLVVPVATVITSLFQFCIQFVIFGVVYLHFWLGGADLRPNAWILALPLIVSLMAVLGLGMGILISALTAKYRDLTFAMSFGVQLWMYATPVVYPLSQVPQQYRLAYSANPMVAVVESFRAAFLGVSEIEPVHIAVGATVTMVILAIGVVMFSRVEKTFMDTV